MNAEQIVGTLASQLDDNGLVALNTLIKHASTQAAYAAVNHQANREDSIQKLATDLANAGFEPHEVVEYLDKLAEQQKTAAECQAILDDCTSMGQWIGKEAGEVASNIILRTLENYVAKHAADDEEEEKEEGKSEGMPPQFVAKEKGSKEDEDEDEKEKEASVRAAKLAEILAPILLK